MQKGTGTIIFGPHIVPVPISDFLLNTGNRIPFFCVCFIVIVCIGCDERYEQENNVPACQAGCGFFFDDAAALASAKAAAAASQQPLQQQPPNRPSVISISLPNLLGQINRMIAPQLGHMMLMRQQQHQPMMSMMSDQHHSMMDDDDMEDLEDELDDLSPFMRVGGNNNALGDNSSEEEESREEGDDSVEFPLMSSGLSAPPARSSSNVMMDSFFGRKDDEEVDLMDPFFGSLFNNVQQQMSRMMQSFPRVGYLIILYSMAVVPAPASFLPVYF
jgi:hypothetical protein